MKIILTKTVSGLGRAGDIKDVSDGYARNFLILRHLALPATTQALNKIQKEEAEHQEKITRENEQFLNFKKKLDHKTIKIKAQSSKKHLFAAIHEAEIAKSINEQLGVEINPSLIKLDKPIKSTGDHEVKIKFAKNIESMVKLNVESE